mgnify:FL=1|jgi:hypothetical protein|tara:strand:+ start:851 stop:976 length:126 start_codon:yes stop_codon:yes gene_type:complete
MKNTKQKDWKDILWEQMSKEDREKENVFNKEPIEKTENTSV